MSDQIEPNTTRCGHGIIGACYTHDQGSTYCYGYVSTLDKKIEKMHDKVHELLEGHIPITVTNTKKWYKDNCEFCEEETE